MQGDLISAGQNIVTERIPCIRKNFQPNFLFPGKVANSAKVKVYFLKHPLRRICFNSTNWFTQISHPCH